MTRFICVQCGTQFADGAAPPAACPICADERQFVRWQGQAWTDLAALATTHALAWSDEHGIDGIRIEPHFAIGQRALLVRGRDAGILWDCVSLATEEAARRIRSSGPITAIAISHPHYYSAMAEWSDLFDGVPIYLHADDRRWIMRPHPAIVAWEGETLAISDDLTLIRCGGHFPGATVLHRRDQEGGALFVGDVAQVVMDRRHVSFMWSYPNIVPLSPQAVRGIAAAVEPFPFERIYGAFRDRNILGGAKAAFARSVDRYLRAIEA